MLFVDTEWADIDDIIRMVRTLNVVIAIIDTRYPELGFMGLSQSEFKR